jgi:hypothetical protein
MNKILIVLLFLSVTLSALAAGGFSTLEEQMTGKEFSAAGLNKLSQQELDVLNDWLRRHSVATIDTPTVSAEVADSGTDQPELKSEDEDEDEDEDDDRSTITSKLVGTFDGWDGQSVFELENGQIWAQTSKSKWHTSEVENPVAVIEPGMFGTWRLHIEGFKKDCRVKRIQ